MHFAKVKSSQRQGCCHSGRCRCLSTPWLRQLVKLFFRSGWEKGEQQRRLIVAARYHAHSIMSCSLKVQVHLRRSVKVVSTDDLMQLESCRNGTALQHGVRFIDQCAVAALTALAPGA
jgi:hypothetical protein